MPVKACLRSALAAPPDTRPSGAESHAGGSDRSDAAPATAAALPVPVPPAARRWRLGLRLRWRWPSWLRLSKLTARVLAVNVMALLILLGGLLYLGRYSERLIQDELESMSVEAALFAGALAEGAALRPSEEGGLPRLDEVTARRIVLRLYQTTGTRTRLFDADGSLMADSRLLGTPGGQVEVESLTDIAFEPDWLRRLADDIYGWVTTRLPERKQWPVYQERPDYRATQYPPAARALSGEMSQQVWAAPQGGQVLGVAAPVQQLRAVLGAVMITRDTDRIERLIQSLREDILKVFAVTLAITVLLSLYLASSITRPIRRLAAATERVRHGHGRQQEIPDFSRRSDEIGELSAGLRAMTAALWARMDAIERFAADVAHEIKNPLSSLRSAVETTARVTDPNQQRRLMAIILEDVQRLDRLITDISDASRLDAELSRARSGPVDLRVMLQALAALYRDAEVGRNGDSAPPEIVLDLPAEDVQLTVPGLEGRLVQVFRNILGNALSFSPPGGRITIAASASPVAVDIAIADEGPGIPEAKLAAIFDRFYSERPEGEKFGTHSGLGLSISRQIVEAHGGTIHAENREAPSGARFVVRLPKK